mgnify:CR=1 FL=1
MLEALPAAECPPAATALLVPGFTGSKEDFIALLEPLSAAGYRVVAVDGRGQYESAAGAAGAVARSAYGLGALAEDVLAQAEALGTEPVHLVGHSLGGLIARGAVLRAVAAGRAQPFASLTLMASGPGRVASWQRWKVRALSACLPLLGPARLWQLVTRRPEPGEVGEFLRRRWLANAPEQLLVTGRTLRHEPDRVARLAAVGLPVHVVSGERDGAWPVPLLDRMADELGAHRTVIRGAGHSPNAERPRATAAALIAFWAGVKLPPSLAEPGAERVSR